MAEFSVAEQQEPQFSVAMPAAITTNLSPDSVSYRANNAAFGLSDKTGIPPAQFKDDIGSGREGIVREEAASKVNNTRQQWAKQMITQFGYDLPDSTVKTMLKAQEPDSVFEEHYAQAYMNYLNWNKGDTKGFLPPVPTRSWSTGDMSNTYNLENIPKDSWLYQVQRETPEFFDWVKRSGGLVEAKNQYILTKLQNAGYESGIGDKISTMGIDLFTAGLYGETQMRQSTAGTPWYAGLGGLGSNLKAQSEALWKMEDFDDFRKEFDRIYDSVPTAYREQWAHDMFFKNSDSVIDDNIMTVANAAIWGKGLFNLGRNLTHPFLKDNAFHVAYGGAGYNGISSFSKHEDALAFLKAQEAYGGSGIITQEANNLQKLWNKMSVGQRIAAPIKAQDQFQRIITAVRDMTTPRPLNVSPDITAPAQAGNVMESAVNTVAIDGINGFYSGNNPLKTMVDRLSAINDADNTLAASSPGRLGREAANRLYDMLNAHQKDYIDTVFNALLQRVDRTPTVEMREQLHTIQRSLADLYRGPDNQVVNVSKGLWLPGLNVRMFNIAVGTNDADLFKSIEEAKAISRNNGWAIKGDYAVGPEERLALVRKENLIKALEAQKISETPSVADTHIRLYRGAEQNGHAAFPGSSLTGGWFTTKLSKAKLHGEVSYIDIAKDNKEIWKHFAQGHGGADEFITDNEAIKSLQKPYIESSNVNTILQNRINKLQKELDAVPRHQTGVTIEEQKPYWSSSRPMYDKPIGPLELRNPKGAGMKAGDKSGFTPEGRSMEDALRKPTEAVWSNKDHDLPIRVLGEKPNKGPDGRLYQKVEYEGKETYVPADEIKYPKTSSNTPKTIAEALRDMGSTKRVTRQDIEKWAAENPQGTTSDMLDKFHPGWRQHPDVDLSKYEISPNVYRWGLPSNKDVATGKFIRATDEEGNRNYPRTSVKGKTKPTGEIPSDLNDEMPSFVTDKIAAHDVKEKVAKSSAPFNPVPEAKIVQQGNGFYILHTVYLPEEANFVRDGILTGKYGQMSKDEFRDVLAKGGVSTAIPPDWGNGWVHAVTTMLGVAAPSEVMSIAENLNRNVATHGPSVLLGLVKRGLKPIEEMPKKYWNDFNRLLRHLQVSVDPETGVPGKWFNTMSEVDDWYYRTVGRNATEQEVRAYFAFKNLMLDDLHFRNMSVMSRKLAMGAAQHAVEYYDDGQKVVSPFFEGVRISDRMPETGRALYVSHENGGKHSFRYVTDLFKSKPDLIKDIEEGRATMIHVMDPSSKPLRDADPRTADYIISYNTHEKPLGFDHVNRLGGGHLIPKWDWFVKQADVETTKTGERTISVYNGDKTLLSFKTKADADRAIISLEKVRQKLLEYVGRVPEGKTTEEIARWENEGGAMGRENEILDEAAVLARETGIPFNKISDMWLGPNAPFNIREPLVSVPKSAKIMNMGEEGAALRARHRVRRPDGQWDELIDSTKRGSLLSQTMPEFTQERDAEGLWTMRFKGTEGNPYFAYEPAELLDPMTSMERGYNNIVQSMFLHDMKQFSMMHWLEQAAPYLEASSIDEIRNNPLKFFYDPQWKKDVQLSNFQIIQHLNSNRMAALDFVGLESKYDTWIRRLAQSVFDQFYGEGYTARALADIPKLTKWVDWAKNTAFYLYLSGFTSFFTQAASMSNIYALAPQHALKATSAMTMYGLWKRFSGTEEILNEIDRNLSTHFGWAPGKFAEATRMLEGSGVNIVGQEHAFRQGAASLGLQSANEVTPFGQAVKTTQKYGQALLNITAMPFEYGASTTRIAGFYTSYLEHLEKAAGGVMDRQLQASMLARAVLLDTNMTRAHNARLQNGILSIPLQFASYDMRLAQMMWGKNLTPAEKMRLFATSSILYGARGGYAAMFGIPITGMVMDKVMQLGYTPGQNQVADVAVNGFASWFFAMLSGFTDADGKKTWTDFSKWGSRGDPLNIEEFFDKDKGISDWLLGASGGAFKSVWQNSWGLRQIPGHAFGATEYKPSMADLDQLLKSFRLYNDVNTAYIAWNTGKLFTQHGTNITDVSQAQAFMKAIMGLAPLDSTNTFNRQRVIKENEDNIRQTQALITQMLSRYWISSKMGNKSNAALHYQNALTLLNTPAIPSHKKEETWRAANNNVISNLKDRVEQKLFIEQQDDLNTYLNIRRTER